MIVDFLIAVVRSSLGTSPACLQWPGAGIVDAACRHGVLPQLSAFLPSIAVVPDSVRAAVKERMSDSTRRMLSMTSQLRVTVDAITAARLDVLPVKGPMLADILYGHPAARGWLSDLDLVVRPRDFQRAMEVLIDIGYERREILHDEHDHGWEDEANLVPLTAGWASRLELHSVLGGGAGMRPLDIDAVFTRASARRFAGTTMLTAAPEDTLLYLCVHGSQHMWSRLQWVCDVARFMQIETNVDWTAMIAAADSIHARRALALGVYLTSELFGMIPPPAAGRLLRDRTLPRLARMVRRNMQMLADDSAASRLFTLQCRLALRETSRQRASLLLSLFRPNYLDRTMFSFPRGLRWAPLVVRPIRIIAVSLRRRFIRM